MKNKSKLILLVLVAVVLSLPPALGFGANLPTKNIRVTLYTYSLGSQSYSYAYNLSEIIKRGSDWLRVDVMSTSNPLEAVLLLHENKKNSLAMFSATNFYGAYKGFKPFDKPITSLRAIGMYCPAVNVFATLNPEIKSLADLKGKTVAYWSPASGFNVPIDKAMEASGLKPGGYKQTIMGFAKIANSLKGGLVDAALFGFTGAPLNPNPALAELLSTKKVYWIPTPPDVMKAVRATGWPHIPGIIPAGTVSQITKDLHGFGAGKGLVTHCDVALDDGIVYEFLKVWYENFNELTKMLGPSFAKSTAADLGNTGYDSEFVHPIALKFYKNHGISFPKY